MNLINDRVAVDIAVALVPPVHRKRLAPTYRPPQFRWVSEQNAQRQLSRPFFPQKRSGSARLWRTCLFQHKRWRCTSYEPPVSSCYIVAS